MQNGLRISKGESFLKRIAPNYCEVILKHLALKVQFPSWNWQQYPLLTTAYYRDFFCHQFLRTVCSLMKKHLTPKNTALEADTLCDPSQCKAASQTSHKHPSHCHMCTSNFFATGAPASASSRHPTLPHKVQSVPFQLSAPQSSWGTGRCRKGKRSSVESGQDIFH